MQNTHIWYDYNSSDVFLQHLYRIFYSVFLTALSVRHLLYIQICIPHQTDIHFSRHFTPFPNRPYYQRLPPVHVSRGKYIFHIRTVFPFFRCHICPFIHSHTKSFCYILFAPKETCRNQHKVNPTIYSLPASSAIIMRPLFSSFFGSNFTNVALQTLLFLSLWNSLTVV